MSKRTQVVKRPTIDHTKFLKILKATFAKNETKLNKGKVVEGIAKKLDKGRMAPILTQQALIKAVHCIRKHNYTMKDYGKVIEEINVPKYYVITKTSLNNIYDDVLAKGTDKGITYDQAADLSQRIFKFVARALEHGDSVRIPHIGTFSVKKTSGRHYAVKHGDQIKRGYKAPHLYVSWTASTVLNKNVANDLDIAKF